METIFELSIVKIFANPSMAPFLKFYQYIYQYYCASGVSNLKRLMNFLRIKHFILYLSKYSVTPKTIVVNFVAFNFQQ